MTDKKPTESDIASEFRELGKNLSEALRSAWGSEERKKLQQEIKTGLKDFGDSLNRAAEDVSQSKVAQNLKADAQDFGKRVRSGELEAKVRTDLLAALRSVNAQLEKLFSKQPPTKPGEEG
jgi:hypothetical protein